VPPVSIVALADAGEACGVSSGTGLPSASSIVGVEVVAGAAGRLVLAVTPGSPGVGSAAAVAAGLPAGAGVDRAVAAGVGRVVGAAAGVAGGGVAGGVDARAGGAMDGGAAAPPSTNAQPSTDPWLGLDPAAPTGLYVHGPPRSAVQYDQWAVAGGVVEHGSLAGVGRPSIRQTKPGTLATWSTAWPASRASGRH
jgi:hypothetical protein